MSKQDQPKKENAERADAAKATAKPAEKQPEPQTAADAAADSVAGDDAAAGDDAPPSLEEQLAAAEAKANQHYDDFLRAKADLENYRRRAETEMQKTAQFVLTDFALAIGEVRDCLQQALAAPTTDNADANADANASTAATAAAVREGVELTLRKLDTALQRQHISPITPDIGVAFDPMIHQAIGTAPASKDAPAESIAQVVQPGYMLHGRVIRPANVMVAKAEEAAAKPAADNDSAAQKDADAGDKTAGNSGAKS